MNFLDKKTYSLNSKALTALVLGILVLLNILSLSLFVRFDWTKNNQYSISDSTLSVLENLQDLVTVKAYFTNDLPPQMIPMKQYVSDILSEYEAYGSGNFDYEYVDPADRSEDLYEAQKIGIQQVRMQVREGDSLQVKNGYFGLGIFYEGKSEVIPVIQAQNVANLEYDVTSLILKVSREKLPVLGFLSGHDEHEKGYQTVRELLRKNYEIKQINVSEQDALSNLDILVVAGPKKNFSDQDRFEIEQYLLSGGNALFLLDGIAQAENSVELSPLDVNTKTLLEPLGVTVQSNLLLDSLSDFGQFSEGPGSFFFLQYPPFVRLVNQNFSEHPAVAKIESLVVRFVSSLSILEKEGLTYDRFLNTSTSSWTQDAPFQTNPTNLPPAGEGKKGPQVFGVQVSGLMPRLTDFPSDPQGKKKKILTKAEKEAKVIVLADADFVTDPALQNDQTPAVVLLNLVDSLAFGNELISIRSKVLGSATIKDLDSTKKSLLKFVGIVLMPALIVFYGFGRLWLRRKEEKLLKL